MEMGKSTNDIAQPRHSLKSQLLNVYHQHTIDDLCSRVQPIISNGIMKGERKPGVINYYVYILVSVFLFAIGLPTQVI